MATNLRDTDGIGVEIAPAATPHTSFPPDGAAHAADDREPDRAEP
jgi:hypothetical protein